MDRKLRKYLEDILNSINEIEFFLKDRPKEYETFCNDLLFRRGVERNIMHTIHSAKISYGR